MCRSAGKLKLVVCMTHTTTDGKPKILPDCTYPLTGKQIADMLITDKAVFRFVSGRMILEEVLPGSSIEEI